MQLISAIADSFRLIAKKPLAVVPALAAGIAMVALLWLSADSVFDIVFDVLVLEQIPETASAAFPFRLLAMYPTQFIVLAAVLFVSALVTVIADVFYARIAKQAVEGKSLSVSEAAKYAASSLGKTVALVVFFSLLLLFFAIVAWLSFVLMWAVDIAGLVASIALFALAFFLAIKLVFSVQSMAVDEVSVKEALQKSWAFTAGKFWLVFALLIIVNVIASVIFEASDFIGNLMPSDEIAMAVNAVFWAVNFSFQGLVLGFYYLKKGNKKP